MMDIENLSELLRSTTDHKVRKEAEEKLTELRPVIGFGTKLLQVVMSVDMDCKIRQAAVIYLKNLICSSWTCSQSGTSGEMVSFSIPEQDKMIIRDTLVDAVVSAPNIIRIQLAVCVSQVIRHDFPERCPQIVNKVWSYLQSGDTSKWLGALLCLYRLVKYYQYKKIIDKAPLLEVMKEFLPRLYDLIFQLLSDNSDHSVSVQKQILKIYFSLTQFTLPLDLITKDVFEKWMEVLRLITESDIPVHTLKTENVEDRSQLIWWKNKKWALHTLSSLFSRYGSPGNVSKKYEEFSHWFLNSFSGGILAAIFRILDEYRRNVFVSSRVMQQALQYLNTGVKHSLTWKLMKPHILEVLQYIVLPLVSYSESDSELWAMDPYEYIKVKFDIFHDILSPVTAAQNLLRSVCNKRKEVLQKIMNFLLSLFLTEGITPSQKDGALHMIGILAGILLNNSVYKQHMGKFLRQVIFPELNSSQGHLRARACWLLHYFSDAEYESEGRLSEAFRLLVLCLLRDKEPPVKVEAAIAMEMLLTSQGKSSKKFVQPQIREIVLELLKLLKATENEELTNVVRKIVCNFTEQIAPLAVEICENLVSTFLQVLDDPDAGEGKSMTAMGLMNTMRCTLDVMQRRPNIYRSLELVILKAVRYVFTDCVSELYEDAIGLCCALTEWQISQDMWKMLQIIYDLFQREGIDYFSEMMPLLYNYVSVDTKTFLSSPHFLEYMFNMIKAVLELDQSVIIPENTECLAIKLLEVIILQCKGMDINGKIFTFVSTIIERMTRDMESSKARVMCIQVIIAALYYNPTIFLNTMDKIHIPRRSVFAYVLSQWFNSIDNFVGAHSRKMCVIGLAYLMQMSDNPSVVSYAQYIVPSALKFFQGLKRAHAEQNGMENIEREDVSKDNVEQLMIESEDELEDERIVKNVTKAANNPVNVSGTMSLDDDIDTDEEEANLEAFITPLDNGGLMDEYSMFKEVLQGIKCSNPSWYIRLTENLSETQMKTLSEVVSSVKMKTDARESQKKFKVEIPQRYHNVPGYPRNIGM